ncbi:helix-turn-helix transcriptional regulator [Thermobifida halotolerans]|uniref:Helix-turn-helix transcriptional regulator n=1 Tax=Thermobifida halotolerans TaxID=483545 RepID=A0A399G5T4_9ACTN|nr:TetR/AcrR family transcriptional regulator [Thermobifida halotolerans]UOE20515.1 helix-turn-helix transcriptional regulator [Thermobifida halotolerans]
MTDDPNQTARRPPRERADAARNRRRILEAAARLFAEHGVDGVTMDAVAQAAAVGKGTVFRRFGDKSGLVAALLDERERQLQAAVLSGDPPLGPGAPPEQRVAAFLDAYVSYLADHLELVRLSETAAPGARYRIGAYHFWHRHLALLCAHVPDPDHLAHVLLGALDADLNRALLDRGYDWPRIRAGVGDLAARILGGGP